MARKDSQFLQLVKEYEEAILAGESIFLDARDLLDIYDYYTSEGRQGDAQLCLIIALRLHPDNEEVVITKAYMLRDSGNSAEAHDVVSQLPNQESEDVRFYYAEEALTQGRVEQAERIFSSVITASQSPVSCAADIAEIYLDYGYGRKALLLIDSCRTNEPADARRLLELKAECYIFLGEHRKAGEVLNQLIDLNPYDDISWTQFAEVQTKEQQFQEAIDSCDYALAINPKSAPAWRLKILALQETEGYLSALKCLQSKPRDVKVDAVVYYVLACAARDASQYDKSLKLFHEAFASSQEQGVARVDIIADYSYTLILVERYEEALDVMLTTCNYGSTPIDVHVNLAHFCYQAGNRSKAVHFLKTAAAYDSFSPSTCTLVAMAMYGIRCFAEAREIWQKIFSWRQLLSDELKQILPVVEQYL